MRLLHALQLGRGTAGPASAAPPPLEDAQLAATQAIGDRQERFRGDLDAIARIVAHLQQLGPLVEGLREPLMVEFDAFRRDHADLLAARGQIERLVASERDLREIERELKVRLGDLDRAGERDGVEIGELRKSLADVMDEAARTREALLQAVTDNEEHQAADAAARLAIQRLEEDADVLRARVEQGSERHREADALMARVQQDADLADAENAALRSRLDELIEELSRGTRREGQLQAELATERERAAGQIAQAERASRDALAQAEAAETALLASRAHVANLSARLEAGAARSAKLEHLCRELSSRATAALSHGQTMESLAGDNRNAAARAAERIGELELALAELKASQVGIERERRTAIERGEQLASALQAQEAATARALERGVLLESSLKDIADEDEQLRRKHEDQVRELSAETRRVAAELQLSQASLRAARDQRAVAIA